MLAYYLVDHYGDLASVVGLLITLIGFAVTLRNVKKAERAAEDARQAARDALARIGSHLLVTEVGTSLHLIREIDAACRERNWTKAFDRCDEARIRIPFLLENRGLKLEERKVISGAIDDLKSTWHDLPKLRDAPESKRIFQRVLNRFHDMITTLSRIQGRIQSEALEVKNGR